MRSLDISRLYALFLLLFLSGVHSSLFAGDEETTKTLRVGVYENRPKIHADEHRLPGGIFIDIFEEIAREEKWIPVYVWCEWEHCLGLLKAGEIDLLPDVAYSAEREEVFDFHTEPVLSSWSALYAKDWHFFRSLNDIDGRRIAVLKGSVQYAELRKMVAGFGFSVSFVEADSFDEAYRAVLDGRADAVVVNYFSGDYFSRIYDLKKTPVVFNPVNLHFAVPRGKHGDVLGAIDRHLQRLKGEPKSAYYRAVQRWMEPPIKEVFPRWFWWMIAGVALVAAILGGYFLLLRWLLKKQSRRLTEAAERLSQTQRMEAIGRLAGGIAHDFNNMLTVISGYSELLLSTTPLDSPARKPLEAVLDAARRSAEITRQLLAFARKQSVQPRPLDLNGVIERSHYLLGRLLGEHVAVEVNLTVPLWQVLLDPGQAAQILFNLCINARDAMPEGGTIKIATAHRSFTDQDAARHEGAVAGDYVELVVTDTGHGMDKETVNHIFEPFYTTKQPGKGTGLGLATVYGVVTQNGGFVAVDSAPGKGSSFHVFLPRYREGAAPVLFSQSDRDVVQGNGEVILVVEDDALIRRLVCTMLEQIGYRPIEADGPAVAVRLAAEYKDVIALLLTDVVMPGMTGRDLARLFMSHYPALKVLFMSGYTSDALAHQGVVEEGFHFIQKPFSVADLARAVRDALRK